MELRGSGIWAVVGLLLVWSVGATVATAYFFFQQRDTAAELAELESIVEEIRGDLSGIEQAYLDLREGVVLVDVEIDYGNGRIDTFQDVPLWREGATALLALLTVEDVEYTMYSFGVFVESINGVTNSEKTNQWWLYSVVRAGEEISPEVGAEQFTLSTGDLVRWTYTQF
ncbi:MAG: DUF4430 domain-containing protein [Candidatus Geothermarchaeales archaeon]